MTVDELRAWLLLHADGISQFMDYQVGPSTEAELADVLGRFWFRRPEWNAPGYRFLPMGTDGSGSLLAAWWRRGRPGPTPVVYFGSEGGHGVLASSPIRWAQTIAHAPGITEYPVPSQLDSAGNWLLEDDEDGSAAAAHSAYRAAATARFGPLPPLASLTDGLDAMNAEFCTWVGALQAARQADSEREQLTAEDANTAARAAAQAAIDAGMHCPVCGSSELRILSGSPPRLGCRACGRSLDTPRGA